MAVTDAQRTPTLRMIAGLRPSLIPSEARVATAMLERTAPPDEWSVAQIAAVAGASAATVVRTCRSLGFAGFSELRDVLIRERRGPAPVTEAPADATAVAQRTIAAAAEQLESMAVMLDAETLERAVSALAGARRVVFVTMSDLAMLGHYAVFRFAMVGRAAEAPVDPITLHTVVAQLDERDVCVAVGHSGSNGLTNRIVAETRATGTTLIAITSFARGPLAEAADIHLPVGSADLTDPVHDLSRTRVGQMVMIDVLQSALAARADTSAATSRAFRTLSQYVHRR
jgi:RpiR family transcriptional regulator, carbohydrate utilization regulator